MVRAKFRVDAVKPWGEDSFVVELSAVTDGSEENRSFWKYTPAGDIQMTIDNPEAVKQFEPGREFYVDFTPAG